MKKIDNYYQDENNGYDTYEPYKSQAQYQIKKNLVKQKISQEYTNDMLGKALSSAEHLSNRFGKEKNKLDMKFNYYNLFDSGLTKSKENLKKSLMTFLDALQYYYETDHTQDFPSNFSKQDIINYLKYLGSNCYEEDQDIFTDFIRIIKGGKVDFSVYFNKNAKVDPNVLATNGVSSMKLAARQEKEWEDNVAERGDYPVGLKMGMDWNSNRHIPNSMKNQNYK